MAGVTRRFSLSIFRNLSFNPHPGLMAGVTRGAIGIHIPGYLVSIRTPA